VWERKHQPINSLELEFDIFRNTYVLKCAMYLLVINGYFIKKTTTLSYPFNVTASLKSEFLSEL